MKKRLPLLIGGGLIAAVFSGCKEDAPPPVIVVVKEKPGARTAATPGAPDPAGDAMRDLETFAARSADPDETLARCAAAFPKVKGTSYEIRYYEIEDKAKLARAEREREKLCASTLEQAARLRASDPAFSRVEEARGLFKQALDAAGPRKIEVEGLVRDYERLLETSALQKADQLRAVIVIAVRRMKYDDAVKAVEAYPAAFRATPHWPALQEFLKEQEALYLKAMDALYAQKQYQWKEWKVSSEENNKEGAPRLVKEHAGRRQCFLTHPTDAKQPSVLEREARLPAGKRATLEFWVASHPGGSWELRVKVDQQVVHTQAVGREWKQVRIDLSSFAGRTVTLCLENATTGKPNSYGYWSDIDLKLE